MPKFSVEESVHIDAAPADVRALITDLKRWESWSPWLSAEPDCKLTYGEDGSWYRWDGEVIGSGKLTITSTSETAIACYLQFYKPWKSQADVVFYVEQDGDGSRVRWSMHSALPFFMFFMKKMMVGFLSADFRRGLTKLKDLAETGSVPSKNEFVGVGEGFVGAYVGLRADDVPIDELGSRMTAQFQRLHQWMNDTGVDASAPPLSITHRFDFVKKRTDYTVAIPVKNVPSELPDGFASGALSVPKTYKVKHTGAYRHLSSAWSAAMMHQRSKKFRPRKGCDPFEIYVSDPSSTAESELVTEVHLPAAG